MEPLLEASHASLRFAAPTERRGSLKEWTLAMLSGKMRHRSFLAVDDVSFRIGRGETVGLVGRNGAGKSTLLKMVSGIARPSSGSVSVRGQVAPLLALGNGLDPSLTGRENIYLNGAILGYRKEYLRAKEESIAAFSELGSFIDAPVRTYSSGMTMRLAFSIATAAVPEILILDEVLAVGDAAFQAKCRARIAEIIEGGATVLFVSHSLSDIRQLCRRVIWLNKGRVVMDGPAETICPLFADFSGLPFLPLRDMLHPLADGTLPVCRFRLQRDGRHVLASNRVEMQNIHVKLADWDCEGVAFRAFSEPRAGTVPLYRFLERMSDAHVFAAGDGEATEYRADDGKWKFEKPLGYVYPGPVPDSVPVFRLFRPDLPGCRIAVGEKERDAMLADSRGFVEKFPPFYAPVVQETILQGNTEKPSQSAPNVTEQESK